MGFALNNIFYCFNAKFNRLASGVSDQKWIQDIVNAMGEIINNIMWPAIAIILTLGIVYCIILGVNYAKAETSDKKEEAKKRIVNAVVGVVIMLALIAILKVVVDNIPEIAGWVDDMAAV